MDEFIRGSESNPWSPSTTYVNLGSLPRVLTLAKKCGLLEGAVICRSHGGPWTNDKEVKIWNFSDRMIKQLLDLHKQSSDDIGKNLESYSSIKMIKVLREITDIGQELDKVNLEIHRYLRESETRDMTHADILGKRILVVDELAHQMARIMDKKDELIKRLQQPFVGEYLEIDAAYHRDTAEVFPMVASNLAALPIHLENIAWAKNFPLSDGKLASVLSNIESSLAELQSYFQTLCQSRRAMHQLAGKSIDGSVEKKY